MKNYKKIYRDLEMNVLSELRDKVNKSKYTSKFVDEKAIKVELFDDGELSIVDDKLVFIDSNGNYHNVVTNISLETLIDLLNKIIICNLNK